MQQESEQGPVPVPTDPQRLKRFVKFFKNYMNVSSVVGAALPIPVTSFGLIPVFSAHKPLLSVYTTLVCFLILAFVFHNRHLLGRIMFRPKFRRKQPDVSRSCERQNTATRRWIREVVPARIVASMPLTLILGAFFCVYAYSAELDRHVNFIRTEVNAAIAYAGDGYERRSLRESELKLEQLLDMEAIGRKPPNSSRAFLLKYAYPENVSRTSISEPRKSAAPTSLLIVYYIGIFACAEGAFVLMAMREYLQDLLGLTDDVVIKFKV
jgi:hypothetical protein